MVAYTVLILVGLLSAPRRHSLARLAPEPLDDRAERRHVRLVHGDEREPELLPALPQLAGQPADEADPLLKSRMPQAFTSADRQ
jgi:hypothetical protein